MTAPDYSQYAFISLGANLPSREGDPVHTLDKALERLRALSEAPLLRSSFWRSSPVDCPPGSPIYVNAVAALLPCAGETALSLLHKLQAIEQDFGRVRSGTRNEARVLDLDLLAFRTERSDTAELILPHPRAHERRFVLEPLREITGDAGIPELLTKLGALSARLQDQFVERLAR